MGYKFKIFLIAIVFLFNFSFAKTQQEEYQNDFLYSEEYFDYLIECASYEAQEQEERAKQENKQESISLEEALSEDIISNDFEPLKIKIENNVIAKYQETLKKEDTKTIIPITKRFSLVQDTLKFKNKYNSNDYRTLAGAQYQMGNFFNVAGGLETNYRNLDQTPISRKLYITPTLKFSDRFSLSFYNKFNTLNNSSDHDISFNISPFKSNIADFRIYTGLTVNPEKKNSESISFTTNFYF